MLLTKRRLCGLLAMAPVSRIARAASWPGEPVRIVVPYAAGGANDLMARGYGEAFSTAFGQPFVIENRTGGAGLVGTQAVARAQPNGLTLLASGMPSLVVAPAMAAHAGLDAMKDFTHIAFLGGPPQCAVGA